MLNSQDLNEYLKLPPEFRADIDPLIETVLDDYFECRSYVRCSLEYYGEDAFKDTHAYKEVKYDILNDELPHNFELKLLATLELMRKENCYEKYPD